MSQDKIVEGGIYRQLVMGKLGTGDTTRDTSMESFWRAQLLPNGKVEAELLDINDQSTGYREKYEPSAFLAKFVYQPDYQMGAAAANNKQNQADQIAARGERHLADAEYLSAEFEFNKALKLDEEHVRANFGLGTTYLATGELDKAKFIFQKLSQIEAVFEPKHKHIFNEFGIQLRKLGMFSEAVRHYNKALQMGESDENLFFNLGRALCEWGEVAKGTLAIKRALAMNPEIEGGKQYLAYIEQHGKPPLAEPCQEGQEGDLQMEEKRNEDKGCQTGLKRTTFS